MNQPALPPLQASAALARTLAETMLANVRSATALNLAAARALLQHARIKPPPSFGPRTEAWQGAWRCFEICATSADQIIGLSRGQVERSTQALWRQAERLIGELPAQHSAATNDLRATFEALQRAQEALWHATQEAHGALLLWVQNPAEPAAGPVPGASPGSTPRPEAAVAALRRPVMVTEPAHATH